MLQNTECKDSLWSDLYTYCTFLVNKPGCVIHKFPKDLRYYFSRIFIEVVRMLRELVIVYTVDSVYKFGSKIVLFVSIFIVRRKVYWDGIIPLHYLVTLHRKLVTSAILRRVHLNVAMGLGY